MRSLLSREQIRRIDALAVSRYGLPSIVLMENAGRGAAEVIEREFGPSGDALVLCGVGNNGGDGFAIARHLHNSDWRVRLFLVGESARMPPDARTNFEVCNRMSLTIQAIDVDNLRVLSQFLNQDRIIVDALLGTGFAGSVRSPFAEVIAAVNGARTKAVVAVDVPSGLECDTGIPADATIRADLTITFVAAKRGFVLPSAAPYVGRVVVVGIGAPRELVAEVAQDGGWQAGA